MTRDNIDSMRTEMKAVIAEFRAIASSFPDDEAVLVQRVFGLGCRAQDLAWEIDRAKDDMNHEADQRMGM